MTWLTEEGGGRAAQQQQQEYADHVAVSGREPRFRLEIDFKHLSSLHDVQ